MQQFDRTFKAFNTVNTVRIFATNAMQAHQALDAVEQDCARFERLFSHTLPESSLVRVNNAGGAPVAVEPELAYLIGSALKYCAATNGLFDITIGPVVALWDFANMHVPEPSALAQAVAHVDYQTVHVQADSVCIDDPDTSIALGGIAKGFIADALCALLKDFGIRHGFVNLGGNVAVFGGKPDGSRWNVGLRVPRPSAQSPEAAFAAVQLADGSVVTSGIYERAFTAEDGTFYHHILDPRTGMPAQTDVASASLISTQSLDGDGYTTALVIMGIDRALAFVESLPECEAVLVARTGGVYTTSGVGKRVPFDMLAV